jgi:hypothetical protein
MSQWQKSTDWAGDDNRTKRKCRSVEPTRATLAKLMAQMRLAFFCRRAAYATGRACLLNAWRLDHPANQGKMGSLKTRRFSSSAAAQHECQVFSFDLACLGRL